MSAADYPREGQLQQIGDRCQLRFTRRLPHAPEKAWWALTEPQHLAAWFPAEIQGERRAGALLRFVHRDGAGPTVAGKMLTYDPPAVLELEWGNDETLRFELRPDGDGTLLTFLNAFDELGKAARDAAGWHACLDVLVYHLNEKRPPWTPGERWQRVHESYVVRLGPDAATIGPPGRPS